MPRPKAILQSVYPYHVTARCLNKEWFNIPLNEVWEIMCRQLCYINWVYKVKIHSFVLMPNHFHLVISTPQSNLDIVMANFMKECSRYINEKTGRINSVYGARHFRSIIKSDHHYRNVYKYVYRNPVEAGLSSSCQNYPFSSLNFLLGQQHAGFSVSYDSVLFFNVDSALEWLNTKPVEEHWQAIANAVKKSEFKVTKNKKLIHELDYKLM